uniref:Uncharacterized protein n=1 Tax=Solanum tuberosum TaxID=4113 RepID=M1BAN7_SOLTU
MHLSLPQCGTFRRDSEFNRAPMWIPDTGWETKKKKKKNALVNFNITYMHVNC